MRQVHAAGESGHLLRAGLLLAVAAGVLTAGRAQEVKGLAKEVQELAREVEAGKDVTKRAAALSKRLRDIRAAMQLYGPRSLGGVGFGPKGVGIERRLIVLDEDGLSAATLKAESADLTRLAHVTIVVADASRGFAPEKPFLGRGRKEWERDFGAVQEGSRDLMKAVQAGDAKAVRAAASRINKACDSCHDGKR
jgi:hypothetical protein